MRHATYRVELKIRARGRTRESRTVWVEARSEAESIDLATSSTAASIVSATAAEVDVVREDLLEVEIRETLDRDGFPLRRGVRITSTARTEGAAGVRGRVVRIYRRNGRELVNVRKFKNQSLHTIEPARCRLQLGETRESAQATLDALVMEGRKRK